MLDVDETWICTCAMLSIEPGSVAVGKFDPDKRAAAGLIAISEGLTTPVDCAGLLTPRPFRKIVTTEPAAAGFEQLFCVPSPLSARGCKPEMLWPLHAALSNRGWLKADAEMKTLGWRSTKGDLLDYETTCETRQLD